MKIDISAECVDEIFMAELESLVTWPVDDLTHEEDIEAWEAIKFHAQALKDLIKP